MRFLNLLICILLGSTATLAQAVQIPRDASDCSDAFFNALVNEDTKTLTKLLAPDFAMVSFDGQLIDARVLSEGLEGGQLVVETGTIVGKYARNYNDAGVVTGTWLVRAQVQGNSFNNRLAFTTVCIKQGGLWKVASVQFTPAP